MPARSDTADKEASRYISELVFNRYGIQMRDGKEALIKARLGQRMRHHGLTSLPAYCQFLREQDDAEELTRVADALTTNFTHFLREPEHFHFLVEQALPAAWAGSGNPFRVWSAACSSGEEACSIGMHLDEHSPAFPGLEWQVTATDISTKVLGKARLGIYDEVQVKALPQPWLRKYFQKGVGRWEGQYRVKRSIADRIQFQQVNLVGDYSHPHSFAVVFLRNVMIYFDRAGQEQMVNQVCRFLAPQGYLLIGHSETLNGLNVPLRCLRPSIYQNTVE
jgi:chemotaxis protein methyltransferase CheR